MNKLLKIDDHSDIDTYIYSDEKDNLIGVAIVNDNLKYNKIKINIVKEDENDKYGSELLEEILKEYKKTHVNTTELIFRVGKDSIIKDILYKYGAIKIDNDDGVVEIVLPLYKK